MAVYTKEKIAKSKSAALELLVKVGSRRYLLQFILFIFFIIASKLQGNWMWRPLQVLQITRASSVASELRISDVFNKFYGELGQKSKLPDSGESTLKQKNKNKRKHSCAVLPFCKWYFFFFFLQLRTHTLLVFVTVLGKIYELLGVLAEVHPSDMVNNSDKLYKAYLGELKEQVGWRDGGGINGNLGSLVF